MQMPMTCLHLCLLYTTYVAQLLCIYSFYFIFNELKKMTDCTFKVFNVFSICFMF